MARRTREDIAKELARVGGAINRTTAAQADRYAERLELFKAGRALEPRMTYHELAVAARCKDESVTDALRKDQARQAAKGRNGKH